MTYSRQIIEILTDKIDAIADELAAINNERDSRYLYLVGYSPQRFVLGSKPNVYSSTMLV